MADSEIPSNKAEENKGHPGANEREAGKPDKDGRSPDIATLIDAHSRQSEADREERRRQDRGKSCREWATIILLFLAFAATVIQAIIFHGQLDEMRKAYEPISQQASAASGQLTVMQGQLREMHDAGSRTDKLIDANVKLAGAAQESADTANKNLIATQRAWVGTIDASIIKGEIGTPIKGTAAYINSGREPAKVSLSGAEYIYTRDEWNNGKAVEDITTHQQDCLNIQAIAGFRFAWPTTGFNNYFMHFPEGQIPQVGVIPWSDRLNQGQDILVVQGCIVYEAFGDIHHTTFCYAYDSRIADMAHLNICTAGNYVN
jgi:hypothetical protein